MTERRYSDEDVQRILASAAESDTLGTGGTGRGMTLVEIQRIAAEAGVSPASVTAAAVALDQAPTATSSDRVLGLRVAVASTVALPRALDDAEWRRLVAFLRDTFQAQGREDQEPGRREWRNGNLRISIESIGESALLQMRTRRGGSGSLIRTGVALLVAGGAIEAVNAMAHTGVAAASGMLTLALTGGAMAVAGAVQLPRWSAARSDQFAAVAEYAHRLSSSDQTPRLG